MAGADLTPAELRRYARHLVLPEVGEAGQRRLRAARVLMVGAGGLGSPAGLYLAAAGIGTIGIVDDDRVDETNLQRQILFGASSVGHPKAAAAARRLTDLNPEVEIEPVAARLTSRNAFDVVRRFDIVVDGSDNFPTRYLVNDACVLLGKPDVYGAVFRFDGQASVFGAPGGPCYRCLFRDPPPPELVPSCEQAGVIGAIPGIIGTLQALEVIKLVTGAGQPLIGRLMLVDGLAAHVREIAVQRDPECPICGGAPTIRQLVDYEAFCGAVPAGATAGDPAEVEPADLAHTLRAPGLVQLVDVREPWEWQVCRLDGAQLIPLRELAARVSELDPERPVVAFCHTGVRSLAAARFLRECGFQNARSLRGGVERWAVEIDSSMARY
jgi:molybdopterin/thiamine biosynthesis adenylyltransferase/rhodanese-related sulfurtransferase